jgi:DNA topoisomerase-1
MSKHVLIITEKPDAALRIASALDEKENPQRLYDNSVPYYVARRGREIVVVPALGHLYTITGEQKGRSYPVFTFKWVPRYVAERKATRIRSWLQTITKLAKEAEIFIDACDYDVEGCIIGYCILKYACGNKEQMSKRMKYSTLTKQELEKSYAEPLPHLDFGLIEAGLTRHEVDWLYGINLSRALTNATKNWSGRYATISTGRVQGPTLKFLVTREEDIKTFVPTPYWQIKAKVEINGQLFEAKYEKQRVETGKEAEAIVDACKNKKGQIEEVEVREFIQPPPFPFDLGTLQNEAYNLFKYTPRRTLSIAQQLYLNALISYPRTDSQKLPSTIGYKMILKNLSKAEEYKRLTSELLAQQTLRPNEGKKDDPAHPAIYPTGNLPEKGLETSERKIWDLVARRFMSVFGESAVKQSMKVCLAVDGHHFYLDGRRILTEGWMHYYEPYVRFEEVILPPIKEGQPVNIKRMVLESLLTEPPSRYNPSSLLREMEETGIGTKATRADTIQTLYDRGYVKDERMTVTGLGFEVSGILERHCPTIISTTLTRELETKMNRIQENKEKREEVLIEVVEILKPVLERLKKEEKTIGEQLGSALEKAKLEERTIDTCPVCKTGKLIVTYSRKTGKRFVGCTNYFKGLCKTSFPLPQKGTLRLDGKKCPKCSWPTIEVRMKRRPWILCFNPECPSNRGREGS